MISRTILLQWPACRLLALHTKTNTPDTKHESSSHTAQHTIRSKAAFHTPPACSSPIPCSSRKPSNCYLSYFAFMPKQKPKAMLSAISSKEQLDDQSTRLLSEVETGHPCLFSHTAYMQLYLYTHIIQTPSWQCLLKLIGLFSSILVAYTCMLNVDPVQTPIRPR